MHRLFHLLFGWLDRLPNWLRAGVITGFFTAAPGFVASVTDWLDDFFSWAAGEPVEFPDLSVLRVAAVSLIAGCVTGGLNAIARWVQERRNTGKPPVYTAQHRATSSGGYGGSGATHYLGDDAWSFHADGPGLRFDERGQSTRAIAIAALIVAIVVLVLVL
jgi:hypothetical protein